MLSGTVWMRLRVSITSNLRAQARSSYSTKVRGSKSFAASSIALSDLKRYTILASIVGTAGLCWLLVNNCNNTTHDNVPHLESPPSDHWDVEPGPSPDQVTRIISQGAYSYLVRNVAGVSRYDGAQLASNSPCEDQFTHGKFPSPWAGRKQWMTWAIFDGHSGLQTSELLKKQLLPFVRHSLSQINPASAEDPVSNELLQHAIIKGFTSLDDSIVKTALTTSQSEKSLQEKLKKLAPAYSGSCALLSMYDSNTRTLHVACTGDSRAVLGQQRPDGGWKAIPLSVDQNGKNKTEVARLHIEHPGEENMVKNGRILGIAVSRAFGDGQWKWPVEFQKDVQRRFYGPPPLVPTYDIQTPPYLTAEPVVTSMKMYPENPSFLIMATDGLWDMISSQQAVNLVGEWLRSQTAETANNELEPTYDPFDFGQFWKGVSWKFVEGRTTFRDENAAVHLVRNALGGNHHELIAGRLALGSPSSRRLRDDTTVQVVFFHSPDLEK